jgi:hypothetical protein
MIRLHLDRSDSNALFFERDGHENNSTIRRSGTEPS